MLLLLTGHYYYIFRIVDSLANNVALNSSSSSITFIGT
jgi:hypothetical protein